MTGSKAEIVGSVERLLEYHHPEAQPVHPGRIEPASEGARRPLQTVRIMIIASTMLRIGSIKYLVLVHVFQNIYNY